MCHLHQGTSIAELSCPLHFRAFDIYNLVHVRFLPVPHCDLSFPPVSLQECCCIILRIICNSRLPPIYATVYTMSGPPVLPSQNSIAASSSVQHELFRFRNPVMLRSQRGTITCIRSHQVQRRERIFLNIYHLHKCLNNRCFNCCCMGIFHSGIEMFGTEIAFGGSPDDNTGIFQCSPMHTISPRHFGEEFELLSSTCVGYTKMSPCHLTKLIDLISPEWPGNSYNLISRNCNHFVEFFLAQIACRNQPPSFVNRCSRLAVSIKCCLPKIITSMDFGSPSAVCA